MGTYTLRVDIDSNQYPVLKASGYNLCIAKKVNDTYNVVWSGGDFLQSNYFEWTEQYQLFGQSNFASGTLVRAQTLDQDVKFGQTCVMEKDGTLDPATGPIDQSGIFHFENDYGIIHAGVNGKIGNAFQPIFVSPAVVAGTADLEPIVSIMAWFDLKLTTSVMFLESISHCIEVTYQGTTDHAISYQGKTVGVWVLESFSGVALAQPRRGYSRDTGFFYEDSSADPHTFLEAARSYRNPRAIESAASQAVLECSVEFPTSSNADDARAYLKQKIIPNICQVVSDEVDDLTFTAKLKLSPITFMKEMMKGATDEEKIKNAFTSELEGLAIQPTGVKFSNGALTAVNRLYILLSLGTHIVLDREVDSKTAVIGTNMVAVSRHEEWKFIPAEHGLFYITGTRTSHPTYLSVLGHAEPGSLVVHTKTKMLWAVRAALGGIRITVPGTDLSIVLGPKVHNHYEIKLAFPVEHAMNIWKPIMVVPN